MEKTFHMLLYRAFHAERNCLRPSLNQIGLEVGQPKLLGYLSANGPCRQNQLADYFEIDSAAVSRMVDALEKNGFVTRRPDEHSRRCTWLELTGSGRQAYESWRARCREVEAVMLRDFSPAEREQFAGFLARAYQNLRGEQGGDTCGN